MDRLGVSSGVLEECVEHDDVDDFRYCVPKCYLLVTKVSVDTVIAPKDIADAKGNTTIKTAPVKGRDDRLRVAPDGDSNMESTAAAKRVKRVNCPCWAYRTAREFSSRQLGSKVHDRAKSMCVDSQ